MVGDAVAVIGVGHHDRGEPKPADAELLEVIEMVDDALEVADAVAISIREGVDEHLIIGRVLGIVDVALAAIDVERFAFLVPDTLTFFFSACAVKEGETVVPVSGDA